MMREKSKIMYCISFILFLGVIQKGFNKVYPDNYYDSDFKNKTHEYNMGPNNNLDGGIGNNNDIGDFHYYFDNTDYFNNYEDFQYYDKKDEYYEHNYYKSN